LFTLAWSVFFLKVFVLLLSRRIVRISVSCVCFYFHFPELELMKRCLDDFDRERDIEHKMICDLCEKPPEPSFGNIDAGYIPKVTFPFPVSTDVLTEINQCLSNDSKVFGGFLAVRLKFEDNFTWVTLLQSIVNIAQTEWKTEFVDKLFNRESTLDIRFRFAGLCTMEDGGDREKMNASYKRELDVLSEEYRKPDQVKNELEQILPSLGDVIDPQVQRLLGLLSELKKKLSQSGLYVPAFDEVQNVCELRSKKMSEAVSVSLRVRELHS
jgi:hypothetical protein